MGIFKLLFGKSSDKKKIDSVNTCEISPVGMYIVKEGVIIPLAMLPGNGSIKDLVDASGLSYRKDSHVIHTFDEALFECIVFKRRTKIPVALMLRDHQQSIDMEKVNAAIKRIDWDFEYRQLDFEDNM